MDGGADVICSLRERDMHLAVRDIDGGAVVSDMFAMRT